jgi:hypothetical protein
MLGRRAEPRPDAPRRDRPEFEPLLGRQAPRGEPLESRTLVCVVGSRRPVGVRELGRRLHTRDGDPVQGFEPVSLQLDGSGRVSCHSAIDRLHTERLVPGRYQLSATARTGARVAGRGAVEFTILPAGGN